MSPRGLKKDLTSYGDAAFSLFLRKAYVKAAGYSEDALERPIVGIANTHSDFNPCHGNVPAILEAVKRGVMLAGALPMVFPTISMLVGCEKASCRLMVGKTMGSAPASMTPRFTARGWPGRCHGRG